MSYDTDHCVTFSQSKNPLLTTENEDMEYEITNVSWESSLVSLLLQIHVTFQWGSETYHDIDTVGYAGKFSGLRRSNPSSGLFDGNKGGWDWFSVGRYKTFINSCGVNVHNRLPGFVNGFFNKCELYALPWFKYTDVTFIRRTRNSENAINAACWYHLPYHLKH